MSIFDKFRKKDQPNSPEAGNSAEKEWTQTMENAPGFAGNRPVESFEQRAARLDNKGLSPISVLEPYRDNSAEAEENNYARSFDPKSDRTDRILIAIDNMRDGHIHPGPLAKTESFTLWPGPEAGKNFREGIVSGAVGEQQEREILSYIDTPVERDGFGPTMDKIRPLGRESKILGYMVGGPEGFAHSENLGPNALEAFCRHYATALDFDQDSADFLDMIERSNGPNKRKTYEVAMSNLKNAIYGEQQEYHETFKELSEQVVKERTANARHFAPGQSRS